VVRGVTQLRLYREAAELAGVTAPADELRTSILLDGTTWNGRDPAAYAAGFAIHAR
jgi:nitrate/nitrite transport system substrate-binding protein